MKVISRKIYSAIMFIFDRQYRINRRITKTNHEALISLLEMERFIPGIVRIDGVDYHYTDGASFVSAYKAIFENRIYEFKCTSSPTIIDGGSNVGLASIFWKRLFPDARIYAFEPDPYVFKRLEINLGRFHNIFLRNEALWTKASSLPFHADGADSGSVVNASKEMPRIKAVALEEVLHEIRMPINLLKLDIEGAEIEVLIAAKDNLQTVERIFVEWHSYTNQPQRLSELLEVLSRGGFRYHLQPELVAANPFIGLPEDHGMDQRINIFAIRNKYI